MLGVLCAVIFGAIRFFLVPEDRRRWEWFLAASALAVPAAAVCEGLTFGRCTRNERHYRAGRLGSVAGEVKRLPLTAAGATCSV